MKPELFRSKHIIPAVYHAVLNKEFGGEWRDWEPETLWSEIRRVYGVSVSGEVRSKLMALRVFLSTDRFWTDATVFENIVLAMNDTLVLPDQVQIATPKEISYALRVLLPIGPPLKFSREVLGYIRTSCHMEGLLKYPSLLRFAEPDYAGELAKIYSQIQARDYGDELDELNTVQMQSQKLYDTELYSSAKLASMQPDAYEVSTQ